ncbi:uncharacterized protein G2W53_015972 [Senna tora]|uniref:Late embryogenesis abundant protein LEA-2 subgroup domain-containing protein n=1 Tax=Senna tora TaxID=362788 RepID=A0A835C6I6_9FABA|nr:uncharacterized protein G2W53_015972 [Senna tora]
MATSTPNLPTTVDSAAGPNGVSPPPLPPALAAVHSNRCKFNFCLYLVFVIFVSMVFFITLFSFFNPNQYADPEFQVVDAAVISSNTSVNGGAVYMTGRWNMTLLIKIPPTNTFISYMNFRASLVYDSFSEDVSTTRLHALRTSFHMKETRVSVQFVSLKQYNVTNNGDDDDDENDDVTSRFVRDDEEFKVRLFARYKLIRNGEEDEDEKIRSFECYPIKMSYFTKVSSIPPSVRNCKIIVSPTVSSVFSSAAATDVLPPFQVSYRDLRVELWHKAYSQRVASTCASPILSQGPKNETRVGVEFNAGGGRMAVENCADVASDD